MSDSKSAGASTASRIIKTVTSMLPHVSNPKPTPMSPPNRATDPSRVFQPAPSGPRPIQGPGLTPSGPLGSTKMPFDTKAMPKAPQPMPFDTKARPKAPAPLPAPRTAPAAPAPKNYPLPQQTPPQPQPHDIP